jgi:hypothetical protein
MSKGTRGIPDPLTANARKMSIPCPLCKRVLNTFRLAVQEARSTLLKLRMLERLIAHAPLDHRLSLVEGVELERGAGSKRRGGTRKPADDGGELHDGLKATEAGARRRAVKKLAQQRYLNDSSIVSTLPVRTHALPGEEGD